MKFLYVLSDLYLKLCITDIAFVFIFYVVYRKWIYKVGWLWKGLERKN